MAMFPLRRNGYVAATAPPLEPPKGPVVTSKKSVLTVLTAAAVTIVGLPHNASAAYNECFDQYNSTRLQRVQVCIMLDWRDYFGGVYNKYRIRGVMSRYSSAPNAVMTLKWVKLEQSTIDGWVYQGGTNPNYPKTNTANETQIQHWTPDFARAVDCQIQRGYLTYRVKFNTGQIVDGWADTVSLNTCY